MPGRQKIGRFDLGMRDVDLFLRSGTGGNFSGADSMIEIGADWTWPEVLAALLHEAFELCAADACARFATSPNYSNDHASWLFVMDHTKMSEIIARVAYFSAGAVPAACKAFNERQKKAVKAKPKKEK